MRLNEPLLRLPIRFDVAALRANVDALPDEAWVPHPDKLPGNEAVRLVTTNGEMTDNIAAPMQPTRYLRQSPYMMQIMGEIGAVWGRSRLMRLSGGSVVPPHVDTNYYWRTHVRVHIPVITTPEVQFTVAGQTVHMAAGECWVFDTFRNHNVRNGGPNSRTHLVLDTVGGQGFWDLIEEARAGGSTEPRLIAPNASAAKPLAFEQHVPAPVMTPWELRYHVDFIKEMTQPDPLADVIAKHLDRFVAGWAGAWAQFGPSPAGTPSYRALIHQLKSVLMSLNGQRLVLRNHLALYRQLDELLYTVETPLPAPSNLRFAS